MKTYTDEEIQHLVSGFWNRTLLHSEWTHDAHILVAAAACFDFPHDAQDRMQSGIQALNSHFGIFMTPTGGYHNTLTIAYVRMIAEHIHKSGLEGRTAKINSAVEAFRDKSVVLKHFSRELISSWEARSGWVEPDLEPLP